jgi:hypothetical protein
MEITEKQRAILALQALPEQATIDDAIERLCFIAKIDNPATLQRRMAPGIRRYEDLASR